MSKTYMFQAAHHMGSILEDTDLITLEEAEELWEKYYQIAMSRLRKGEFMELALWEDCKDKTDYRKERRYIYTCENCKVKNGGIYELKEVYLGGILTK